MQESSQNYTLRLGIDIGKVIIASNPEDLSESMFGRDFIQAPEVDGAMEAIRMLRNKRPWEVYLVSKCGPEMQSKIRFWLEAHDFFAITGMNRDNIRFCLDRAEKSKWAGRLHLTHFIDDRIDILRSLPNTVTTRILFAPVGQAEVSSLGPIFTAHSWQDVLRLLA